MASLKYPATAKGWGKRLYESYREQRSSEKPPPWRSLSESQQLLWAARALQRVSVVLIERALGKPAESTARR